MKTTTTTKKKKKKEKKKNNPDRPKRERHCWIFVLCSSLLTIFRLGVEQFNELFTYLQSSFCKETA